jgi:hypothetical protein
VYGVRSSERQDGRRKWEFLETGGESVASVAVPHMWRCGCWDDAPQMFGDRRHWKYHHLHQLCKGLPTHRSATAITFSNRYHYYGVQETIATHLSSVKVKLGNEIVCGRTKAGGWEASLPQPHEILSSPISLHDTTHSFSLPLALLHTIITRCISVQLFCR